ncbi:MAG: RNA polymerase sigma-70 factor [Prolixibacteraceae bacterium]|nr:RNA polymerase sigma-70 factor [Prolixibacteraceae bacterium]
MKDGSDRKGRFKDIFEDNYEYLRNYLYYLSGDIALAEDLVQDVFIRLWEKIDEIRPETARAFLFTVARNGFFKIRRRQKYDLKFRSGYFENTDNKSPEYLMELEEYDKRLQRVISGLPDRCRVIFLLNRIDGMSYKEIARNTGVTVKAVEKQISKALSVIRKDLGDNAGLI